MQNGLAGGKPIRERVVYGICAFLLGSLAKLAADWSAKYITEPKLSRLFAPFCMEIHVFELFAESSFFRLMFVLIPGW